MLDPDPVFSDSTGFGFFLMIHLDPIAGSVFFYDVGSGSATLDLQPFLGSSGVDERNSFLSSSV